MTKRSRAVKPRPPAIRPGGPSSRAPVLGILGIFAAVMAYVLLVVHRIPLYGVETDLFGEYIPAARALLAGQPTAAAYEFKGPGYPLLLAFSMFFTLGDAWLAARLLNLLAALVAAGFTFQLARRLVGDTAALFVLVALCANPLFVRTTIEAGTDVPTFALSNVATYYALTCRGPRGAALAGFLAGMAILCRYNAAFLVPAGVLALVLSRDRSVSRAGLLAAYGLGLAAPLVPWLVLNHRLTGSAFSNRNYTNLAFELYGRGMSWDQFWAEVAPRFKSFADVLRYDPALAITRWGQNLGTRWIADLRLLVPPWLGVAALVGAAFHLRRAAAGAGAIGHAVLCYATLGLIFYSPRFFLYLVPFYLLGAALAFFPRAGGLTRIGRWGGVASAVVVVASGVVAARETSALMANPPVEILQAGKILRPLAQPGDRLMARKPQVAYFANMTYEPVPQVETLHQLLVEARRAGARYVIYSGIEASLRPQFRLLVEADIQLPGFTLLARQVEDPNHYFVLYRVEPEVPAEASFGDALVIALAGLAARYPGDPRVHAHAGALLLDEGEIAAAMRHLDRAIELDPRSVQSRSLRAAALVDLGQLDAAARDCEEVIASLARPSAEIHVLLGSIRAGQGRWGDAQLAFEAATRLEPANVSARIMLGATLLARGNIPGGQAEIEQAIRLVPDLAPLRAVALERAERGDTIGLARLIEMTRRTTRSGGKVEAVVDSVRAGRG